MQRKNVINTLIIFTVIMLIVGYVLYQYQPKQEVVGEGTAFTFTEHNPDEYCHREQDIFTNIEQALAQPEAVCRLFLSDLGTSLDIDFSQFVNLRELRITMPVLENLPDSVGTVTQLEILSLNRSISITELPESASNLQNLRLLDISDTAISSLSEGIYSIPTIQQLILHKEQLSSENIQQFKNTHPQAFVVELNRSVPARLLPPE